MDEAIVRERAAEISRTLGNCKKFIHQGNVYACLSGFKDVLEKMLVTRMLPQDEKDLQEGINEFQRQLMTSAAFRNAFGPVTFQDSDNETTLAFIRQLVNVSEEEIAQGLAGGDESRENRALMIMRLIDKGEHEKARALIGGNEDLLSFILHTYNARGIQADRERCLWLVERSLMAVTALVPRIGYKEAARVAQEAHRTGKTVREVVLRLGLVPEGELDRLLDLSSMTEPGIRPGKPGDRPGGPADQR